MTTTNTTPPKTTRAALYARVSTTGHGQDVGLQLDELRAVAHQRGWHVVGEHVDDGVSGAATSRPALDEMMEQARRGRLDLTGWRPHGLLAPGQGGGQVGGQTGASRHGDPEALQRSPTSRIRPRRAAA